MATCCVPETFTGALLSSETSEKWIWKSYFFNDEQLMWMKLPQCPSLRRLCVSHPPAGARSRPGSSSTIAEIHPAGRWSQSVLLNALNSRAHVELQWLTLPCLVLRHCCCWGNSLFPRCFGTSLSPPGFFSVALCPPQENGVCTRFSQPVAPADFLLLNGISQRRSKSKTFPSCCPQWKLCLHWGYRTRPSVSYRTFLLS